MDSNRNAMDVRPSRAKAAKPAMTFGDFIMGVYDTWGKRRAREIVRLAVNAHLVVFRGHRHFAIS